MGRFVNNRELRSQGYAYRLPYGSTSLRPSSPVNGLVRFNEDTNQIEAYYNSTWNSLAKVGNATIEKDSQASPTSGGATLESADGVRTTFTMSQSYTSGQEAQVICYVGNVYQNPIVTYTFNGTTTITFTSPPPLGQTIVILHNLASTATA
jgi:hypothetical protein